MYLTSGYSLVNLQKGNIVNDTLVWNTNVNILQSETNSINIIVIGYTINQNVEFTANLDVLNDIDTTNNVSTRDVMIRDSLNSNPANGFPYDPNNKLVDHPIVKTGKNSI